jgi:hypothetical protein
MADAAEAMAHASQQMALQQAQLQMQQQAAAQQAYSDAYYGSSPYDPYYYGGYYGGVVATFPGYWPGSGHGHGGHDGHGHDGHDGHHGHAAMPVPFLRQPGSHDWSTWSTRTAGSFLPPLQGSYASPSPGAAMRSGHGGGR